VTAGMQDDLRQFAVTLLERRGALVDWPSPGRPGEAILTPELARSLGSSQEMVRLSCTAGGDTLCVSLASDFLDEAARVLQSEPRIGAFRVPDLYLKGGKIDEAIRRAFTWLNAKVEVRETRAMKLEYHTWWFHAMAVSEDRWETRLRVTINSLSGAAVEIPDPLGLWESRPGSADSRRVPWTHQRAAARATTRVQGLAADFIRRMDSRLERDRKRLRDYYHALLREADKKHARSSSSGDPEKLEARKRAVELELRRKLADLDDRYAMEVTLDPIILVRTELTALAVDLLVWRKQARKVRTVFWNPLLKELEPICCSRCGAETFSVQFTNDDVDPLCPACG
jgi:hypothetical protein